MSARLLHLSDIHLAAPGSPSAHPQIDAAARLPEVLAAAGEFGPYDAVVVTGDIADDGSIDGVRAVRSFLDPIASRMFAVPGNHDSTQAVTDVFGAVDSSVGGWQIAGAATNVPGQVQGDARPLIEALRRLDPARPAICLHHHPVRSHSTHPWFTLEHQAGLEAALRGRRAPLLLLSGHTHEAYDEQDGLVRFVGAPATYYGIRHDGDTWSESGGSTGALAIQLNDDGTADVTRITA